MQHQYDVTAKCPKKCGATRIQAFGWCCYDKIELRCPKCGAAIRPTVMPRPTPQRVKKTRQRLNALDRRERIVGPATLVLRVGMTVSASIPVAVLTGLVGS